MDLDQAIHLLRVAADAVHVARWLRGHLLATAILTCFLTAAVLAYLLLQTNWP